MAVEILIMGRLPALEEHLAASFHLHRFWLNSDRAAFLREIGPRIRGVVTYSGASPLDKSVLDGLPRAEIICNMGAGYESIDIAAAGARGIIVTNAGGVNAVDVAEHAFGLILCVARNMVAADSYVRSGRWKAEGRMPLGRRLSGRKLGILGLGHIGLAVARRGEAFDMPVFYHNRRPVSGVPYQYVDTPEALARSVDVLVVATPGGAQTRRLVDRKVIDALGPGGILVNVGRGSVIDEAALIDALAEGRPRRRRTRCLRDRARHRGTAAVAPQCRSAAPYRRGDARGGRRRDRHGGRQHAEPFRGRIGQVPGGVGEAVGASSAEWRAWAAALGQSSSRARPFSAHEIGDAGQRPGQLTVAVAHGFDQVAALSEGYRRTNSIIRKLGHALPRSAAICAMTWTALQSGRASASSRTAAAVERLIPIWQWIRI